MIDPQGRTNAVRSPEQKRKHESTHSPGPTSPPSLHLDRWALTDTTMAKTVAKRGLGWLGGFGLVEEREHRGGGGAPAGWREEQKKRENGKGFHPQPARPNPSEEKLSPEQD
jgi:hypothetical protein